MRLNIALFFATLVVDAAASAIALPNAEDVARSEPIEHSNAERDAPEYEDLWKRRGGGGGGSKGGGGGGSGGSSGGSSGGATGGGRGSSSSTAGGKTTTGSGPAPAYGGGKYYGGGASSPYAAGLASPLGLAPFFFLPSALLFWPGLWYHPAYLYYPHPYTFHNHTTNQTETKNVTCGCVQDQECGCDDNTNNTEYMTSLIGDGDYNKLNQSVVTVADVPGNGSTILINGTLPPGTTAPGGDEDPFDNAAVRAVLEMAGFWPVVGTVLALVFV